MDLTFNSSNSFYPAVSPSLMKIEWSNLSWFKFNLAFSLGPEYDEYIKECLDWIPDESFLLDGYNEEPPLLFLFPLPSHRQSYLSYL